MTTYKKSIHGLAIYKRLLGYVLPYKIIFLASIFGMAIVALAEVSFAALLKPIMDEGFVERDKAIIQLTPLMLMGVFLARAVGAFTDQYCVALVARKVIFDLRELLFSRMLRLPTTYYDKNSTANLISRLIYDLEQVADASTMAVRVIVKDSLLALGLVIWMFILSWPLTLIFLLITPFVSIVVRKASKRFRRSSEGIQTSMGGITHVAKEALQGQKMVKAFGGYAMEERAFEIENSRNRRQSLRRALVAAISVPLLLLIAGIGVALIIYLALTDTISAFVSPGTFVSYMGAILLLMSPIKRLARINEYIQAGIAASNSVFSVFDSPIEEVAATRTNNRKGEGLIFKNVSFTYPDLEKPAIQNISFKIDHGKTLALVGSSGSGKSTVSSLLLQLYRDFDGDIHVGDRSIRDFSLSELRETVSIVPQDSLLFDRSIIENVLYGNDSYDETLKDKILFETGVDSITPNLDSKVGERGSKLSGGQKQRIAIARALLKAGSIVIFDEATSALDGLSENEICQVISKYCEDRTVILIAHRLRFITHADLILVFNNGEIIESGNHLSLLEANGQYAQMWLAQKEKEKESE